MKIIASDGFKVKVILFISLISIIGGISAASFFSYFNSAVDASVDNLKYKTVIIDAGHGGPDGGTSADDGTLEKDLNLQIALKLNDFLESMGINTVMIRTEDISVYREGDTIARKYRGSDICQHTSESFFATKI